MKKLVAWFATNHVAANVLMGFSIVAGLAALYRIPVKLYPEVELPLINVTVPYLGAAPEEVELGVCARVEEQLQGIPGVKEIRSTSAEALCSVEVELFFSTDRSKVLGEVENLVNAIDTLPAEAEKPIVQLATPTDLIAEIAITGPTDERMLKEIAYQVRADILNQPGITQAEVANVRPYEISVEVSELSLRRNNLSFDDVADALRSRSVDIPGGLIRSADGEVLLRASGQAYWGTELENLLVTTRADGTRVHVKDVARVVDGFAETGQATVFDGRPAALVQVGQVGDQDVRAIAETVRGFVDASAGRYPEGVRLSLWKDDSVLLTDRLGALIRSGLQGLLLVLILLTLCLRPHLAFWVAAGIPIAFLGAIFLMYWIGFSLDGASLIGFILALGMLVDDAVVVGEGAYVAHRKGAGQLAGAIEGAQKVLVPVTFGVLTTAVAFVPLLFAVGGLGKIISVMSGTVICCLAFSLIECQMVLPAHLGHRNARMPLGEFGMTFLAVVIIAAFVVTPDLRTGSGLAAVAAALVCAAHMSGHLSRLGAGFARLQVRFENGLQVFIHKRFRNLARSALRNPPMTLACAFVGLSAAVSIVAAGHLSFTLSPPVKGDTIVARLTMPLGTNAETTEQAIAQLGSTALDLKDQLAGDLGQPVVLHVLETMGTHVSASSRTRQATKAVGSHLGEVTVQLTPSEERPISTYEVADLWQAANGPVTGAKSLTFITDRVQRPPGIEIRLSGPDMEDLRAAAAELRSELAGYPGIDEVNDSLQTGKSELKLSVTPAGEALGITLSDLGGQVRQAFYGEEAQRIQRGRDDVRIMVRYTESERRTLDALYDLRIRTPDGGEVPFASVAEAQPGRGFATIQRTQGSRSINVSARVDPFRTSGGAVLADLEAGFLPDLVRGFSAMSYALQSTQRQQDIVDSVLPVFLLALFVIYGLLALPLRSYVQPLIIMSVLPFAFVGAIFGHVLMAATGRLAGLSMMSLFGMVAASGVVVNASLVLLDGVNRYRAAGDSLHDALLQATVSRFRPILITTVTTFAGLTPLMLSNSVQAHTLIPMAVSVAFGVAFASIAALVVLPAFWLLLHQLSGGALQVAGTVLRRIAGSAPRLSQWMARYPYVQESLRTREFTDLQLPGDLGMDTQEEAAARRGLVRVYYQLEFDAEAMRAELDAIAARTPNANRLVDEARTWAEQRTFQLGAHMADGAITPVEAAGPLTDILETALASLLPVARAEFAKAHEHIPGSRVALVALGPAGRREFAAGSPLELLFVCDYGQPSSIATAPEPAVRHAQLVQFFMRLIRDFSSEGILFEPLPAYILKGQDPETAAPSLRSMEQHFDGQKGPFDRRMLIHARVLEAEGDLGTRFDAFRRSVLNRPPGSTPIAADMAAIRADLMRKHRTEDAWETRYRPGGLAEVELAAEYLQLAHGHDTPEIQVSGLAETFEAAGQYRLIDPIAADELAGAAQLWQNVEGFLRMTWAGAFDPGSASPEQKRTLAGICGLDDFRELQERIRETALKTARRLDELLAR
ncbi:MAG: hypothetical protein F4Z28_06740 [Gammaproteobacteria bacterium]|nr:hypothetical protein [Gammaproteobacteria bacterium]